MTERDEMDQRQEEDLGSLAVFGALQTLRSGWSQAEYERQLRHFGFVEFVVKSAPAEKCRAIDTEPCPF